MKFSGVFTVVLFLLGSLGPRLAKSEPVLPPPNLQLQGRSDFKRFDTDANGKLDQKEFTEQMKENAFKDHDENKDGVLDPGEYVKIDKSGDADKTFDAIDTGKDQKIDFPEFSSAVEHHSNTRDIFISLDSNNDHFLSEDEYASGTPAVRMCAFKF